MVLSSLMRFSPLSGSALARHDPPLAVVSGDERLGDDALQGVREPRADLVVLVRRAAR